MGASSAAEVSSFKSPSMIKVNFYLWEPTFSLPIIASAVRDGARTASRRSRPGAGARSRWAEHLQRVNRATKLRLAFNPICRMERLREGPFETLTELMG